MPDYCFARQQRQADRSRKSAQVRLDYRRRNIRVNVRRDGQSRRRQVSRQARDQEAGTQSTWGNLFGDFQTQEFRRFTAADGH